MQQELPYNLTKHDISRIKAAGFNVDIEAREIDYNENGIYPHQNINSQAPVVTITRYVCGQPVDVKVPLIYLAKLLNRIES